MRSKRAIDWRELLPVLFGVLLCLMLQAPAVQAAETVTLQLKWHHQFQFAGYYAAIAQGYYRDAGLDVQLQEAVPGIEPSAAVLSGQAQYGVGNSDVLLLRQQGKPVVVLATVFQHSPLAFLVRQDAGVQSIHDLAGRRVMLEPGSAELLAYLRKAGIAREKIQAIDHGYNIEALLAGKVAAMSVYVTDEPFRLQLLEIPYQLFRPRMAGIDFYGDNLYTTEQEIAEHPERVKAFRAASLRGWEYAMQHPEEIIDVILERYQPTADRGALLFEAQQMRALIRPDFVEIGYMNKGRWQHIAEVYAEVGLLPPNVDLSGFLYEPKQRIDEQELLRVVFVILSILAVGGGIMAYIWSLHRRLLLKHAQLQQGETLQRALLENMEQAVALINREQKLVLYNHQFAELTGLDAAVLANQPSFDVLQNAWAEKNNLAVETDAALRQIAEGAFCLEFLQDVRTLEMRHAPIEGGGFVRTYTDVSKRKRMEDELRYNVEQLHDLLNDVPAAIALIRYHDNVLLYRNQQTQEILGIVGEQGIGKPLRNVWVQAQEQQRFRRLLEERQVVNHFVAKLRRSDGSEFWASLNARIITLSGIAAIFAAFIDIDKRQRMEEQLLAGERKFRELLAVAPTAIIVVNVADGTILFANDNVVKLGLGDSVEALLGQPAVDFYASPSERQQVLERLQQEGMVSDYEVELLRGLQRQPFWALMGLRLIEMEGQAAIMTSIIDITERKRQEAEILASRREQEEMNQKLQLANQALERLASTDRLTGAWNRRQFEEGTLVAMRRAVEWEQRLFLLLLDVDHFKQINDGFGHQTGDMVLIDLVGVLQQVLPAAASLSRWGGEEFAILLPNMTAQQVRELADLLLDSVAIHEFPTIGRATISIGIADFCATDNLETWLRRADEALYQAKEAGRNCIRWAESPCETTHSVAP